MDDQSPVLPPQKPRFGLRRISLRTLFVLVAVFACGLGLLLKDRQVAQERAAVIEFLETYQLPGGGRTVVMHSDPGMGKARLRRPLPAGLKRWGAEPVYGIRIPSEVFRSEQSGPYFGMAGWNRIESLFPEARVDVEPQQGR